MIGYEGWVDSIFSAKSEETDFFESIYFYSPKEQACALRLSIEVFRNINSVIERYGEHSVCKGLFFFINGMKSHMPYLFTSAELPTELRLEAIEAIYYVFVNFFEPRCQQIASHGRDVSLGCLNDLCYMWWDEFPYHGGGGGADDNVINKAFLSLLERLLNLRNVACKESALHGLGHWHISCPEEVSEIIGNHLNDMPNELIDYAMQATCGNVQ